VRSCRTHVENSQLSKTWELINLAMNDVEETGVPVGRNDGRWPDHQHP